MSASKLKTRKKKISPKKKFKIENKAWKSQPRTHGIPSLQTQPNPKNLTHTLKLSLPEISFVNPKQRNKETHRNSHSNKKPKPSTCSKNTKRTQELKVSSSIDFLQIIQNPTS